MSKIDKLRAEIDLLTNLANDREEYLQLLTDENNKLRSVTVVQETLIRKSEAENEKLRSALQWQPIETAPKDGTEVLAVYKSIHSSWYGVAVWGEPKRGSGKWFWDYAPQPTHWMHLPPPPALKEKNDPQTS
jgi:hypothetical protein